MPPDAGKSETKRRTTPLSLPAGSASARRCAPRRRRGLPQGQSTLHGRRRAGSGGGGLMRCVEQRGDRRGGRHDGERAQAPEGRWCIRVLRGRRYARAAWPRQGARRSSRGGAVARAAKPNAWQGPATTRRPLRAAGKAGEEARSVVGSVGRRLDSQALRIAPAPRASATCGWARRRRERARAVARGGVGNSIMTRCIVGARRDGSLRSVRAGALL